MNDTLIDHENVMRLNVHIARDEYPELFDELSKFNKGVKRIQRLKTIASERLILAGTRLLTETFDDAVVASKEMSKSEKNEMVAAAMEAFGPPIK